MVLMGFLMCLLEGSLRRAISIPIIRENMSLDRQAGSMKFYLNFEIILVFNSNNKARDENS